MEASPIYPNPKTPDWILAVIAILAMIFISLMTSCGTVKKLKHKSEIKSDSTDLTKTVLTQTVTERIDTTIEVKSDSLKQENSLSELLKGDTITEENDNLILKTYEDTVKKTVHTKAISKPKKVHVYQDKKTVTNLKQNKDVEVKKDIKESEKTVERTGIKWYWYVVFILLIILIITYIILRKYYKFLP